MSSNSPPRIFRLCLDLNVFISALIATAGRRRNTACQYLVGIVQAGQSLVGPVQLVIGHRMLIGLERTYISVLGLSPEQAAQEVLLLQTLATYGPAGDPPFAVVGSGVQPLADGEDCTVLECAMAAKANVLATRNMRDFLSKDMSIVVPGRIHALQQPGFDPLFIMHPGVAASCLRDGIFPNTIGSLPVFSAV